MSEMSEKSERRLVAGDLLDLARRRNPVCECLNESPLREGERGEREGRVFGCTHRLMDEPRRSLCRVKPPSPAASRRRAGQEQAPLRFYCGHLSAALPVMTARLWSTFVTRVWNADTLV